MNNQTDFPIDIVFRNLKYSKAIETKAYHAARKLGLYFNSIMSCHVIIETHHHHHKGNIYHVRIDMTVPNKRLAVNRDLEKNHAHEDPYVAIRDAFHAMKKQLQTYAKKQHGIVKHHERPPQEHILDIVPMADYGSIETYTVRQL